MELEIESSYSRMANASTIARIQILKISIHTYFRTVHETTSPSASSTGYCEFQVKAWRVLAEFKLANGQLDTLLLLAIPYK